MTAKKPHVCGLAFLFNFFYALTVKITLSSMPKPAIVRKNPVVILLNFFFLEFVALGVFYIASLSADYGDIYDSLAFSKIIPYEFAEFFLIILFESCLITFVFMKWAFDTYEISPDKISVEKGIFSKTRQEFKMEQPVAVNCRQGLLARLARYGKLEISGAGSKTSIILKYVPSPKKYVELLKWSGRKIVPDLENELNASRLLAQGEHERLEYKTSLRWDAQVNRVNKNLEKSIMKTIAAFLNSEGGHLVIGANDKGSPVGLAPDFATLGKQNADGFENHFTNLFNTAIGAEFRRCIKLSFQKPDNDGKEVCVIRVMPGAKPAFVRLDDNEDFYIRTGNSTTALRPSETATYINSWWPRS